MKTKKLIAILQDLDPEGEQELVAKTNDGYAYNICGADLGTCNEGVIVEDQDVNCIILDATT